MRSPAAPLRSAPPHRPDPAAAAPHRSAPRGQRRARPPWRVPSRPGKLPVKPGGCVVCEVSLCHCRSSNFPTAAAKRKREASRGAARLPAARPGLSLCPRTGSGHRTRARLSHAGHRGGVGRGAGRIARDRGLGWTLSRAGRAFKGKRPLTLPARPPAAAPPSRRGRAPPAPHRHRLCRCRLWERCVPIRDTNRNKLIP